MALAEVTMSFVETLHRALDDVQSSLAVGGVPRLRHRLTIEMPCQGLAEDRKAAVLARLDALAQEHHERLAALERRGVIGVR